jgi:hypothetical protein
VKLGRIEGFIFLKLETHDYQRGTGRALAIERQVGILIKILS